MNHQGTKKLETDRLILRRFQIEDASMMYNNWASEDAVTKFLTWPTHANVDVTEYVLTNWISRYETNDFYNWGIELKETHELIGNISVVKIKENTQAAVLGYCMGTKWWGQEIMPEAGRAVVKYLLEEVGFNRIAADHDKNNPKSGRVMQKIGMTYEGTLRQAGFCNQGVIDEVWYSILKGDYMEKNNTYLSEYCDVRYEEEKNVVFVKWKKFCCMEDYRRPLEYALRIIEKYKCDYVADTRNGFENIQEDTRWVAECFMPKAVEYGCKCIYFIIDESNSLKEELEGQAADSASLIQFKYIYGLEEI